MINKIWSTWNEKNFNAYLCINRVYISDRRSYVHKTWSPKRPKRIFCLNFTFFRSSLFFAILLYIATEMLKVIFLHFTSLTNNCTFTFIYRFFSFTQRCCQMIFFFVESFWNARNSEQFSWFLNLHTGLSLLDLSYPVLLFSFLTKYFFLFSWRNTFSRLWSPVAVSQLSTFWTLFLISHFIWLN